MGFDAVQKRLMSGMTVERRRCTICNGSITYAMDKGHPVLLSCRCGPEERNRTLCPAWPELRTLVEGSGK